MAISKKRKPKPKQETTKSRPPSKKRWGWLKGLFSLGMIGLIIAVLPHMTIEPANAPEASNPFSGVFKVSNGQFYPLKAVHIQAYLWCVKIGRGTDGTPPSKCEKGNIPSSRPAWNEDIAPYGSRQIVAGEALYATPLSLLYAQISIKVSYQPWFLPIPLGREELFYTRRKDDGNVEWLTK